jgi:hypothetical protein
VRFDRKTRQPIHLVYAVNYSTHRHHQIGVPYRFLPREGRSNDPLRSIRNCACDFDVRRRRVDVWLSGCRLLAVGFEQASQIEVDQDGPNEGNLLWFTFQQTGTHLQGTVVSLSKKIPGWDPIFGSHSNPTVSGTIDGSINGSVVDFTVHWDGGARGEYQGTVGDDGSVRGNTHDLDHRESRAHWTAQSGAAICVERPPHPWLHSQGQ